MGTVSGRILLKESELGIGGLLVVVENRAPAANARKRLGSVLTKPDGSFELTYDNQTPSKRAKSTAQLDLLLSVQAPEEPGESVPSRTLYVSTAVRPKAGETEQFLIRLTAAQLRKAGITPPSAVTHAAEPAASVIGKLGDEAKRATAITDGVLATARQQVDARRARFTGFAEQFRPALVTALSRLPSVIQDPDRLVRAGESVHAKTMATIRRGITDTLNSPDTRRRAPITGVISLTANQVDDLRAQAGPDGVVSAAAVAAVARQNGQGTDTTFVQAPDRIALCLAGTPTTDCAAEVLEPETEVPDEEPVVPGPSVTSMTVDDVPRYLARLMNTVTAPEEQLLTGLIPAATRASVQRSVRELSFPPSPADVPATHEFSSLQIAFDYVWQEAIDEGVLDLAQDAYETIVELGGDPLRNDQPSRHPVQALHAEARLSLAGLRDAFGAAVGALTGGRRGQHVTLSNTGTAGSSNGDGASDDDDCGDSDEWIVRDHRGGTSPNTVRDHRTQSANPAERLPAVLQELERRMRANYRFTIYAANAKERSINFGIFNTFHQCWTPLGYECGLLAKSIPLAPRQTQKVVITRKWSRKRSRKELENNLRVLQDESTTTSRTEQEIVRRASTKNDFSVENTASADYEVSSASTTTRFGRESAKSSDDTKRAFHEAVFKSAQEVRQERSTEINTEEVEELETTETTEITNPNDEIAVTFLFYELQRRYRVYERLYRVRPVVLVAQEFPQPQEIDEAWLLTHDWILKRAILDDSFLPALNSLSRSAGAESALAEMRVNLRMQRCIVKQLREQLVSVRRAAELQRTHVERSIFDIIFGREGGSESDREAVKEQAQETADRVRDLTFRLEREVTTLNQLTESYTKALREHHTHLTEIARLQAHVIQNVMHYMQAIWSYEPRDQRFFRLHNVPVPVLARRSHGFRVDFDHPVQGRTLPPHQRLPRFGGLDVQVFPTETAVEFEDELEFEPLSKVADLDNLLGYKGNYMIFPLHQSNALTDFMMDPFVDRATGQLVDPSDPINWSIDEFSEYVCCLKKELTAEEFAQVLPALQEHHKAILSARLRRDDVLVVPTNSLYVEALPAAHSLIEPFKRDHRMVDVKKAQGDVRALELENIRLAARILAGEREDPTIDRKIVVQGDTGTIVVPPDA